MTNYIVPGIVAGTVLYGIVKGVNVFDALMQGIRQGLGVCRTIFPAILTMLVVIHMFRASGAVEVISALLSPLVGPLGIPADCIPLALLRPFSGGGALSIGSDIIKSAGPDSLSGRIAAVMLGSSETSVYTLGVYSAYLGIENTRYTLPASLCSDAAAFLMSGIAVRLLMR